MKITGYKILNVLGMLILHSLPLICYYNFKDDAAQFLTILMASLINIVVIINTEIYYNLFKKIDKQMKKEIKLW